MNLKSSTSELETNANTAARATETKCDLRGDLKEQLQEREQEMRAKTQEMNDREAQIQQKERELQQKEQRLQSIERELQAKEREACQISKENEQLQVGGKQKPRVKHSVENRNFSDKLNWLINFAKHLLIESYF